MRSNTRGQVTGTHMLSVGILFATVAVGVALANEIGVLPVLAIGVVLWLAGPVSVLPGRHG